MEIVYHPNRHGRAVGLTYPTCDQVAKCESEADIRPVPDLPHCHSDAKMSIGTIVYLSLRSLQAQELVFFVDVQGPGRAASFRLTHWVPPGFGRSNKLMFQARRYQDIRKLCYMMQAMMVILMMVVLMTVHRH